MGALVVEGTQDPDMGGPKGVLKGGPLGGLDRVLEGDILTVSG